MFNPKGMSAAIRAKKKATLKPDMDYAGQEALQPTTADEIKQNLEVSNALEDAGVEGMDHEPASAEAMGEHESSQDVKQLKKSVARIAKYFESL